MKKMVLALIVFITFGFSSLFAHEFFVVPRDVKDYKAGDEVKIDVLSTHYFIKGEEIEEPSTLNSVYVLQNGKKTPLVLTANRDRLLYETSWKPENDHPALVVGERIGGYYCYTTEGYMDGTKKEVSASGATVSKCLYFNKLSKTYLNSKTNDESFKKPLGQILEIVPLTNPVDITVGKSGKFQVLYDGKPFANADIFSTYDTFDPKSENAYAKKSKTDKDGIVNFDFDHKGLWLVRVNYHKPSKIADVDEDDISAIMVFNVK
ncbi:MAG: DUF4198 domain-containing protein [Campylobacteraceae bacterium]|jgi:uncharacterized GH25 family protein|nr:DUF4198 domain-containing protein [Campylobacteraceae bacterium]